ILFVKGVIENDMQVETLNHITVYNFMTSHLLEDAINESKLVLSRSGYTTIMDLAKLNKKAFFIPTPGQFEQEYLAELLDANSFVPCCKQDDFTVEKLEKCSDYSGLDAFESELNFKKLFSLFKTE